MRFVFSPPTEEAAGLLSLPWTEPLEERQDPRLVEIRQRGISRHIVRFVADGGELYALKAINENLARRDTACCVSSPSWTCPLWTWWASWRTAAPIWTRSWSPGSWVTRPPTARLLQPPRLPAEGPAARRPGRAAGRLHLTGFFWGDCSLSNTLFRYDAGTLEAYLVDAETSELHPSLTAGQRQYDVDLATERVFGELLDLQAGACSARNGPAGGRRRAAARYERCGTSSPARNPRDDQRTGSPSGCARSTNSVSTPTRWS